jgi:hypothetical protein
VIGSFYKKKGLGRGLGRISGGGSANAKVVPKYFNSRLREEKKCQMTDE